MKIIQLTPSFPPSIGGVQNCVKEISDRLVHAGFQIEVFTSNVDCQGKEYKPVQSYKINYLNGFKIAHTNIIPTLLPNLLKTYTPPRTIIQVHIAQGYIPEIGYLYSRIRKIPYIAHFHTDVERSGKMGFLLQYYKNYFLKRVLLSAQKVICLSDYYRTLLNTRYGIPINKISIIPNGVSEKFFINNQRARQGEVKKLLYVGRLSKEKNVITIVKAASLLKHKVFLDIVGDGEQRAEIERVILTDRVTNVKLHGYKSGKELLGYYKSADIFILASDYEGHPLSILEAMAAGLPVIASRVRGIKELVKDTGILVSPPTAENFASAIDKLASDNNLQVRLSEMGRLKALRYSWANVIHRLEKIYKEVA